MSFPTREELIRKVPEDKVEQFNQSLKESLANDIPERIAYVIAFISVGVIEGDVGF